MKRYPGYLFDLDGTLVDTAADLNAALNHALTGAGLAPVDLAHTRHWVGHGARVLIEQALAARDAADVSVDGLYDAFISYYQGHLAAISRPYPHVVETLEALSARGARLAVVTN
jgi:phosphoglycolate phosphatase